MRAGLRTELIVFQRATAIEDNLGEQIKTWAELTSRRARVRFGTAQEKREAAQEGGVQTATFEVVRGAVVDGVQLRDRISYLGSFWDITETAPLDSATTRFTAVRTV